MSNNDRVYLIPLKDIKLTELNVRTEKDEKIPELAESINKYGLLQPIVLKGKFGIPPYEVIIGKRRFLAHKYLGRKEIRALIKEDLGEVVSKIISLSENMHRVDLNYADKAKAITDLYNHFNKNVKTVSKETGLSESTIRNYVKIEEQATSKGKEMLREKKISQEDLKRVIVAAQGVAKKADELLDYIPSLTKYEKSRIVDYAREHPKTKTATIIKEGQKPKMEYSVFLPLSKELNIALERAARKLALDTISVAKHALSQWLERNGFLKR